MGNQHQLHLIITTAYALHIKIIERHIQLQADGGNAQVHGRRAPHERREIGAEMPGRTLVAQESNVARRFQALKSPKLLFACLIWLRRRKLNSPLCKALADLFPICRQVD